jgi:hypothetical protein
LRDSPRSSSRNPDFDRFYDILRAQLQTHLTHPDWFGLCVTEFADAYYWNEEFETRLEKIDVLFQDMYDEYAFYLIPVDHIRSLTVKIETSSTLSEKEIASTTDNLEKLLKCKDPKKIELGFVFIYHNEVEAVAENVPHGVWANLKAFGPSVYKLKAAGFRIRMATVEYLFEKNNEKNSRDILDWFVLNEEEWIGKVDKEINERGKEDDDVLQGTRS